MCSCKQCGASLALDQRYCVECGSRRGPLPAGIAGRIACGSAIIAGVQGSAAGSDGDGAHREGAVPERSWIERVTKLRPTAIAAAILSMLGFGVIVGTVVSPAEQSEAAQPVLVAQAPSPASSGTGTAVSTPKPPETPSESSESSTPEAETEGTGASVPAIPTSGKTPTSTKHPKTPAGTKAPKSSTPALAPSSATLPPIKHVFLIVLSNQGYDALYGAGSKAPYLARTLSKQGELLPDYYAVTGGELANMIALTSGQGPTVQTAANCPTYSAITPGTVGSEGQVLGNGCVYPQQTLTIADQLTSAGKTWKAYVGGMEDGGAGQPATCRHPTLASTDPNQLPTPGDPYVTWRNPFVYFQSITGGDACSEGDVGLERLAFDLTSAKQTPSLAFIVPDRCHDGSEEPCAPGQAAGLGPADAFLESVVPEIERSPAYREGGLIAITSDQAPQSGPGADSSGCCLTSPYPNLPATSTSTTTSNAGTSIPTTSTTTSNTTITTTSTSASTTSLTSTSSNATSGSTSAEALGAGPAGGGKVGLLLISKYVKPGSVNAIGEYNHFSLLLTIERLFGLKPLGYAATPGLLAFDKSVFNAPATAR